MSGEVHLVLPIVEIEDVARQHGGAPLAHLAAGCLPGAVVVEFDLFYVIDTQRVGNVDLHARTAAEDQHRGIEVVAFDQQQVDARSQAEDQRLGEIETAVVVQEIAHGDAPAVLTGSILVVLDHDRMQ